MLERSRWVRARHPSSVAEPAVARRGLGAAFNRAVGLWVKRSNPLNCDLQSPLVRAGIACSRLGATPSASRGRPLPGVRGSNYPNACFMLDSIPQRDCALVEGRAGVVGASSRLAADSRRADVVAPTRFRSCSRPTRFTHVRTSFPHRDSSAQAQHGRRHPRRRPRFVELASRLLVAVHALKTFWQGRGSLLLVRLLWQ